MNSNDLGVVIIGRNEGDRLINCMKSVKAETGANTIYVDSGSTDASVATATRLGASIVDLDMARPFSAARARNEGFAALVALNPNVRFVQFVDGDCELVPGWLASALNFFSNHDDVAVVCGRRREKHPDASIYNRLCDIEWNTPVGEAAACGGDAMIRSQAFVSVAGYRSDLIAGEEPELCLRLRERGWKVWRLDAEMTRHDAAMYRFGQWWRRTVRGGYAYAEIARLHRNSGLRIYARETLRAVIWGGIVPLAICIGIFFHPALAAGILLYPFQISRIALRQSGDNTTNWAYALFMTIAKFAELQGVIKYNLQRLSGRSATLIEYK